MLKKYEHLIHHNINQYHVFLPAKFWQQGSNFSNVDVDIISFSTLRLGLQPPLLFFRLTPPPKKKQDKHHVPPQRDYFKRKGVLETCMAFRCDLLVLVGVDRVRFIFCILNPSKWLVPTESRGVGTACCFTTRIQWKVVVSSGWDGLQYQDVVLLGKSRAISGKFRLVKYYFPPSSSSLYI